MKPVYISNEVDSFEAVWQIDIGATKHDTNCLDLFINFAQFECSNSIKAVVVDDKKNKK